MILRMTNYSYLHEMISQSHEFRFYILFIIFKIKVSIFYVAYESQKSTERIGIF